MAVDLLNDQVIQMSKLCYQTICVIQYGNNYMKLMFVSTFVNLKSIFEDETFR